MPRIHVTGDAISNTNLVRLPPDTASRSPGLPATSVRRARGGAAYLERVIAVACAGLDVTVTADPWPVDATGASTAPETLTIWAQYPRATGERERVWRVEQFLRTHGAETEAPPPGQPAAPGEGPVDLLVLDDEGLGFRDDPARWARLLAAGPAQVILKTRHPLPGGTLWTELLPLRDRLTVIVPVSALRARHAPITRGLSWDRTIEDAHRELTRGASGHDLALAGRVVIPFGHEGVAVFARREGGPLELERFIYHPERLEGDGAAAQPGRMLGGMSVLTAAIARHLVDPARYPLFIVAARGLAAMADNHRWGGGVASDPSVARLVPFSEDAAAQARLRAVLRPVATSEPPEAAFRAAFHRGEGTSPARGELSCSLLREVTGPSQGHVLAAAIQVVTVGLSRTLDSAPRTRYASFLTVDREEIERTNEIHRLFRAYRANDDPTPLSIAVFGPPGSGKSFAIRQLARHIFGEERETLEWNLSQLAGREDLLAAFDQIRDASVRGRIPLVFWDEFDTGDLRWLREYLMPMQDARYCAGSLSHPFGKVIFVFAGGTAATFQQFDRSRADDAAFRAVKGPDFVSRLRGYVNIKGPNPAPGAEADTSHLIRRASLLRSVIARAHPHLIDPVREVAAVSPSVIRGFLCADGFRHGARSIEQLVKMSDLAGSQHFGVAQLPSPAMLDLHVTDDFLRRVAAGETEEEAVAVLATSPAWADLHAAGASGHTGAAYRARVLIEDLRAVGYRVTRGDGGIGLAALEAPARERLLRLVHEGWLRAHLLLGYDVGPKTRHDLRLHPAIRPWSEVDTGHRARLAETVDAVLGTLEGSGFALAPIAAPGLDDGATP